MVRLKQPRTYLQKIGFSCLNSTMVRLKRIIVRKESAIFHSSQFHYGSIKTDAETMKVLLLEKVSIPLWFD